MSLWAGVVDDEPFHSFTLTLALQLLLGKATEDGQWLIPQFLRNSRVVAAVNSGPSSDNSSSLIPNVTDIKCKQAMRPMALSEVL